MPAQDPNPPPSSDPQADLRLTIVNAAQEWLRIAPKAPEPLAILAALGAVIEPAITQR